MKQIAGILGIIGVLVVVVMASGCVSDSGTDSNYLQPISANDSASYKAAAQEIPLADLLKNANDYSGKKIKQSGTIFQITENSDGTTDILLNTPDTTSYSDRVYVTYNGKVSYVKGDEITVYGEVGGTYSYTSQENYQITLPLIKAVLIEG